MKRSLLVLTAAAVALSPLAANAAPKPTKRTISYEYAGAQAFGASAAGSGSSENGCMAVDGCWDFSTVKGEKVIEIKASDPAVGLQVFYDDAYADNVVLFCGGGKITVSPKTAHVISVRTSVQDCGSVPTTGKIEATITGTK